MVALMSWLDFDEREQELSNEILREFARPQTLDDLGFGQIRDAISNRLFPTTSSAHTRAKYFFLVPWVYQYMSTRRYEPAVVQRRADEWERHQIKRLIEGSGADLEGIMGRSNPTTLKTLPSRAYWNTLRLLGIFQHPTLSRTEYLRVASSHKRSEVDGDAADHPSWWDLGFPTCPDEIAIQTRTPISIQLTFDEATWFAERITRLELTRSTVYGRFVAALLRGDDVDLEWQPIWEANLPDDVSESDRSLIWHAERFSQLMFTVNSLYAAMLGVRRDARRATGPDADAPEAVTGEFYRERLASTAQPSVDALDFAEWAGRLDEFWTLLDFDIAPRTREFTEFMVKAIATSASLLHLVDDPEVSDRIIDRERTVKGPALARFANTTRLDEWTGDAAAAPTWFRWPSCHRLLRDIEQGLNAASEGDLDADA